MKQTLRLKTGQSLVMTPKMQQQMRLLQLSNIELQIEVQELLESNIMLEEDETEQNTKNLDSNDPLYVSFNKNFDNQPTGKTNPEMLGY